MHAPRTPEGVVTAAAVVLLIGAGFGAFHERGAASRQVAMGTMVDIRDFQFGPNELSLPAGGAVTWTNRDSAAHTVRGEGMAAAMSGDLAEGDTYSFTFDEPGTYLYVCSIHPSMEGTIVATDG